MAQIIMTKKMLKELHGLLNSLRDEFQIKLTPEGLECKEVDPAHVALVHIKIPKERLKLYEHLPEETAVSLDVDWLPKIYRKGEKGDIRFEWDKETNKVFLHYFIKEMPIVEMRYAPDMTGMSNVKIPNMTLPCKFEVSADDLAQVTDLAQEFADHIAIEAWDGNVHLRATGDTKSMDAVVCPAPSKERYRSLFPLDYFSNIMRASTFAEKLTVELGNDYPIMLHGRTGEGIEFTFMLAPRLESD